ncbi:MAG: GGDEF domain-containing protein [Planctomycetales bacterium]|nr:GGDEF domain-containing protein [Planctomycetales bacterium]
MSSTKHKPNPFGMIVLVTVVLGLTTLLRMLANDSKLILHLFYLPIACGGLFLGRTRTIILAVIAACSVVLVQTESLWLGTSSGSVVYVGVYPNFHALLHTGIWSLTLLLTATIIGTLSDEWLRTLNRLQESHRVDTMRDSLTKIANRRAFEMELVSRVADWEQQGIPVGLLLVDVDHFKRFNDTYGHQAGDAILQQVAETLKSSMRDIDIVARYGGEEFAIVLTSTSVEKAKLAGERVRSVIEQRRFNYEGLNLRLTVSVGMSHSLPKDTMSTLIERADAALYQAKHDGRDQVRLAA